jgi:hypothetical protein
MRLRYVSGLLLSFFLLSVSVPAYAAAGGITIMVNGGTVTWGNAKPRISLERLMVPAARVGQAMGAKVDWDADALSMFIFLHDRYLWLQDMNTTLYYGTYAVDTATGRMVLLTVNSARSIPRPDVYLGTELTVPLITMVEALGGTVAWYDDMQLAAVTGPPHAQPRQYTPPLSPAPLEEADAAPPRYQAVTAQEALRKYENDDPFMLICFNSKHTNLMEEVAQAASDLQIKIYGLDLDDPDGQATLPFAQRLRNNRPNLFLYAIAGYGRVTFTPITGYDDAYGAMLGYEEAFPQIVP